MKKKPKPKFHPRAPLRLKKLWKDYPAHYRIAKYLNVNPAEVWKALMKGKEPVNQDVRTKFGLPRKPRKPRAARAIKADTPPLPDYLQWWRYELTKTERETIIHLQYINRY